MSVELKRSISTIAAALGAAIFAASCGPVDAKPEQALATHGQRSRAQMGPVPGIVSGGM